MRALVNMLFYLLLVFLLTAVVFAMLNAGKHLELPLTVGYKRFPAWETISRVAGSPIAILLAQMIVIVFASVLCGMLFKKLGQPKVVGEIVAGILLGPSVLGRLCPAAGHFIFPASSMSTLTSLSQLGIILFMFITGMEVDLRVINRKMYSAVVISHSSIAIPFGLGAILSYPL